MNKITSSYSKVALGSILAAGLFFQALPAFAAASFNNDPSDFPTIRVGNSTAQQGTLNWSSSVSANAGEVVAFLIYYHNTSSETATQTRVSASLPSGAFTSSAAVGSVWASNASAATGQATINLTSSQTLTFIPGSVQWFPNRTSSNPQPLPNGQSGDSIISSGGINLGDIAPGWETQGYLTFRAQVSTSQQGSVPTVYTSSASSIGQNSATLNGNVSPNGANTSTWFEYGTTQSLGSQISGQSISGSANTTNITGFLSSLQPNTTYYFRAVAQNSYGTSYGFILSFTTGGTPPGNAPTVVTNSASNIGQNYATLNGSANPNGSNTNIWFEYGTTQSLGYQTNAQTIGSGTSAVNATTYLAGLQTNTTYYFRAGAQNSNGTSYGSILSFTTGGTPPGNAPTVITNSASGIGQNSANLNGSVNPNGSNTSAWFEYGTSQSLGSQTSAQSIGGGASAVSLISYLGSLQANTTYYFRAVAQNSNGTSHGSILSFTTGGTPPGNAPTVITNSASNIGQNYATLNGNVNPNSANTTAWFEYGTSQSLGSQTSAQSIGGGNSSINVSTYLSGLQSNTTYYFRAVAQNSNGTSHGSIMSFTSGSGQQGSAPSVVTNTAYNINQNYATLSGSANPNGANTNIWFEYGTTQSLGNQTSSQSIGGGNSSINMSAYISGLQSNTTYYFRAVAQNSYGTSYGSVLSFITTYGGGGGGGVGQAPTVYTNAATNIIQNNATLNGNVNSNSANTTVWFEYGNSYSLGSITGQQTIGSSNYSNNVSSYLFGLNSNSIYYFRIVAQNAYGTSYGSIMSFTTGGSVQTGGLPYITTSYASAITQNSALLSASVNSNNDPATAWFEWGESTSFGNITYPQGINQNTGTFQITSNITGLKSGTTYYFRGVARNSFGTAYGDTYNFRTQGGYVPTTYVPTTVITQPAITYQVTNVETAGGVSLVALTPSVNNPEPGHGDEITYTVVYRNDGPTDIKNVMLRITLPAEVDYVASNREPFFAGQNALEYNLGTVNALSQGTISVKVRVKDTVKTGTDLVFNALMNYFDSKNKQQQINVYLTVTTVDGNGGQFLASLIGLFGYLFNSWLFNLLLIILILLAAYYFYRLFIASKRQENEKSDLVAQ